ncbi:ABC transporter ATP-binding protein [Desulfococcaceae bacterium HSG7]|nr:ABC transporter ATP-binding protein [Desulfococcaceae bacterium HSG7]
MNAIIKVRELTKIYRLGKIHTNLLSEKLGNTFRTFFDKCKQPSKFWIDTVSVQRKYKSKEEIYALKDVSFEVLPGEVVGVIGRNGAGKSTLLKILSRITTPSSGHVELYGKAASLLEVGTGFHPELTGKENIFLNGAILGMSKNEIKNQFDQIVAFAGIDKFLDTPVKRYSSGMYMRLAFAVAAHLEPEILIIDEVLAVGDLQFQKKCLSKINDIAGQGRTVIFVSHNMAAISSLCSQTYLLENGMIISRGKTSKVISKYISTIHQNADIPLDQRSHDGNGLARITKVIFKHQSGDSNNSFLSGECLKIVIECKSSCTLSNAAYSIGIYDYAGIKLAMLKTSLVNKELEIAKGHNRICCSIPNLPLYPGQYFINVAITTAHELIDGIVRCADFFVEEGDFFGYGFLPDSGPLLIKHDWLS